MAISRSGPSWVEIQSGPTSSPTIQPQFSTCPRAQYSPPSYIVRYKFICTYTDMELCCAKLFWASECSQQRLESRTKQFTVIEIQVVRNIDNVVVRPPLWWEPAYLRALLAMETDGNRRKNLISTFVSIFFWQKQNRVRKIRVRKRDRVTRKYGNKPIQTLSRKE